jgi:hypothetical protein
MAKFKDLHLMLQEEQRILFGDDVLGVYGPAEYPATNLGSEKPFIAYTTISGYNTELPGLGVTTITPTEQLVISVPIAGERGTQPYHMVRFDQLQEAIFEEVSSDWQDSVLTFSGTPPGSPSNGDRYIVDSPATGVWTGLEDYIVEWDTASGTWDTYAPNEGFTTFVEDEDKYYLYYNGAWAPMGEGISHSDLLNLNGDDHTYYVPTDGSRGFTATVSGVYPVENYHLVTKDYVDGAVTAVSGSHGDLVGLEDDDHLQYILTTGARGFTGTVSGIDPTESYHLTTRWYVDDLVSTASGSIVNQIVTDHGGLTGLGDDDHVLYVPTDGSRGFTSTVSGVDPILDYHLATKWYVDDQLASISGITTIISGVYYLDHSALANLDSDDHTQYVPTDASRGFTNTVSGVYPVESYHLATKQYVDDELGNYVTLDTNQTITGEKTFDSLVTVNSGIDFGSSTISGTGDIYTGNIYADNQKWGRIAVIDNARNQAVTFDNAWPDDNYTVVATLTNEVDATPSIYSTIQGVKTGAGFTTHFSGKIDSANFVLEWHAFYGQKH